ncbi:hypothetical protein D3C72_661260 [compost metagenome]
MLVLHWNRVDTGINRVFQYTTFGISLAQKTQSREKHFAGIIAIIRAIGCNGCFKYVRSPLSFSKQFIDRPNP